ncbi:STAS domain-containing protein [Desulfolutivibrio sulfoxidireducens]|uniref:STAS domain-containing protein n=1 Tax=Desulfolutivibrio sulfoxidireducens TaxID=2773299 RepID=UPI00159DBC25|nr:STAS domain-containing protein [Desulfolutivibrio sulfoxidireducens]QLA17299.1 anti-sigma factor antagonist [Desulfolutivibrio sulfoxidireducens]QLA20864.1 anti-sigma factor antagonist [Desulfolutivibrio sulfoxidireducens]
MEERFCVRSEGDRVVILLAGEIVMDMVQEFKMEVESLLTRDGCHEVVADLSAVTFMDSSGIGFLIGLHRRAEAAGRRFRLQNPSPPIKKLLNMLKLSDFFSMEQDREGDPPPV